MKLESSFFTSSLEKRYWLCFLTVILALFLSLFIGRPLATHLADPIIQTLLFVLGMALVGTTILTHGLWAQPGKTEISVILGITAVYLLLIMRLGAAERSHLIEYSVLTVFAHKALRERAKQKKLILKPALLAFFIAFSIGVFDECIQIVLPDRVFDIQDILFNGLAAMMAIGSGLILNWVRNRNKG